MFIEERHKDIIERVNKNGRILVQEIQEVYGVSADCARRDLRYLESKGLVKRTYGGAIMTQPSGIYPETTYNPKDILEIKEEYYAVAQAAVKHIKAHEVVYLTTSSVGYYMAMCIPEDLEVTVLTNSISIAEVLRKKENVAVILLGGEMSHRGHCHDFYTIQMVKNIKIDKAFMSHTGLNLEHGAMIHSSEGVAFGQAVMENSSINIGVYPAEKIGKHSIHSVCEIKAYDLIITDKMVPEEFKIQLQERKIDLEIV